MSRGRIEKALSGFYYVDTGSEVLTCRARGKFRKEGISPLVGDRVEVRELGNGEGFVEAILPRKNAFSRPAVANIDQLVVIASGAILGPIIPPSTNFILLGATVGLSITKLFMIGLVPGLIIGLCLMVKRSSSKRVKPRRSSGTPCPHS